LFFIFYLLKIFKLFYSLRDIATIETRHEQNLSKSSGVTALDDKNLQISSNKSLQKNLEKE
jgi:hypothetical protein